MHLSTDAASRFTPSVADPLPGLLLALWMLSPLSAAAQVQIDQVQQATEQVQGASQGEVIVNAEADVGRQSALDLIPDVAPTPAGADGNSATIFQDGNGNDATIRQAGTGNEASASQLGDDNEIAIAQDGAGSDAVPDIFADEDALRETGVAEDGLTTIQNIILTGAGTRNTAVVVHEGNENQTGILQRGSSNVAGVRLDGDNNVMNVVQTGDDNQFRIDAEVTGEVMGIVQNGSGNVLDTNVPVNAEMNGNGIEMTVTRDALGPVSLE
ncbi:hypothetical protein GGP81_003068 [Salinibacter ruber]|nr:hypothetical protein [Salinibacter ruber]